MAALASRLRQRITIRRPIDTEAEIGSYQRRWQTVAENIPAEVLSQAGREVVINAALQGIAAYKITIRYRTDVTENHSILYGQQELRITAPPVDPNGRRQELVIFADTASPQNARGYP